MDVDIDIEFPDRISDFLRSKLQEIKSQNSHMDACLKHRAEISSQLREKLAQMNTDNSVSLGQVWKKTINGKYVLGLEVKNDSANVLDTVTVTLTWDSSLPLTYHFYLLSNLSTDILKSSTQITQSSLIILTLDVPVFTDQLSYTISGSLTFQLNNKKRHLKFPKTIPLRPQDITDNVTIVQLDNVIDGTINDLQAVAFSSQKQEFMVVISERMGRSVENIFETECALRRINMQAQKKYFLVYKICPVLDGVLLEVDEEQEVVLNTYCKNVEVTLALVHYLHTHIIGAIVVPKPLYQPDLGLGELTELARESLLKEVEQLEQCSGDLKQLRTKMASLEYQSDILVARINEKRSG